MAEPRMITGFRAGDPLRIQRRVGWTRVDYVGEALVDLKIRQGNQIILSKKTRFHEDTPEFRALPGASIRVNPMVKSFHFDLTPRETSKLQVGQPYSYSIASDVDTSQVQSLESGFLVAESSFSSPSPPAPPPLPPPPTAFPGSPNYALETAWTSYADKCETVTGRTALVIDGFVDAIIGAYRQLKVWDEHARRRGDNPSRLQLTYEYINHFTPIEIYDSNNNPVVTSVLHPFDPTYVPGSPSPSTAGRLLIKDPGMVSSPPPPPGPSLPPAPPPPPGPPDLTLADFDYRHGNFSIFGDDGNQDFFVTYTFNFFPEPVLVMFTQQTVLELNFIGAGAGTYATNYTSIEEIPETWLGLVALGVAAKAWKKLATDISIWRNWLIFDGDTGEGIQAPTGAAAQQAADSASQYYQQMYETFASGTKYEKYLAKPTIYWEMFANTGYGSFGMGAMMAGNQVVGGKFQGMVINKGNIV